MFSINNPCNSTSTPKRRRLGTGRILRSKPRIENSDSLINCSPIISNHPVKSKPPERCNSPHLPCNQVEYLYDSVNDSKKSVDIPVSPRVFDSPGREEWESLVVSTSKFDEFCKKTVQESEKIEEEEISHDIFHSKFERLAENHEQPAANHGDKLFKCNINDSFKAINESLCILNELNKNKSLMFETKDSFLLDIKESCTIEKAERSAVDKVSCSSFYGLPVMTKGLFKSYRNIEKLYDWQEECLNLDAIKERRNLIYALPTSGGKTLVAEILMLREVLNRKKNALFILPFVAIVQEKIWSLSPFALQLDFLVEEYAGGKGHIPPKKRRNKNSIYIATIEKGLGLVRSLIELNRLHEIGLIVVDELHLIGEKGRGGTLEMLLSTVIFTNQDIQIVGMSATIGNLDEVARFLRAAVFQRDFRPVELTEYVKLGDLLHELAGGTGELDVRPHRELAYDYSAAAVALDPDKLGGLVSEVVPTGSCLIFCPTKKNCENVATLLCKLQRREMANHRTADRQALELALRAEGAVAELARAARCGVGYHHAGLASEERNLLEQAFRSGVISVLCCTSTLAAGVNLPAQRVIVRAPYVGRDFISLAAYRQMVGRAGRAGVCRTGESIVICGARDWPQFRSVLSGGLAPARSALRPCVASLLLSAVALGVATRRPALHRLLQTTLMHEQDGDSGDIKTVCDDSLRSLLQARALEVAKGSQQDHDGSHLDGGGGQSGGRGGDDCCVYNNSELVVSQLGRAAIKGCMELAVAERLLQDLDTASRGLVLRGSLHLLYLVTPHDAAGVRPDYRHYYTLYGQLDEAGVNTARVLGISEVNAVRMVTGKPITNVPESVLCRFYIALMLHDLWKQVPFPEVAQKYCLPRGKVQAVMTSAAAFAASAVRVCEELPPRWAFRALLAELAPRLQTCAAPELAQLMQLPAVKKARAMQLTRAGYKRVEQLARANAGELVSAVPHLSRSAAEHLISAARMMLIEKVENLRAEAEDVMEELNV